MENTTLRHAVGLLRGDVECVEPNNSKPEYTRWITVYHAPHSGRQDSYSLHFPDRVTATSRKRLIRVLDEEL